jgi:hypothetical protein
VCERKKIERRAKAREKSEKSERRRESERARDPKRERVAWGGKTLSGDFRPPSSTDG